MMQRISLLLRMDSAMIPGIRLLACWFAGSSLGFWAALVSGDAYASVICQAAGIRPEWYGALIPGMVPLLFSACAVLIWSDLGCYAAGAVRGLSQGLFLGLIGVCYGSGAPLMAFLLDFTGLFANGVLLWFWMRRLVPGKQSLGHDLLIALGCGLALAAADGLVIAPFLAEVINH